MKAFNKQTIQSLLISIVTAAFAIGCGSNLAINTECRKLTLAQPSKIELTLTSDDVATARNVVLDTPGSKNAWAEMTAAFGEGSSSGAWVQQIRINPHLNSGQLANRINPVLLTATSEMQMAILVRNTWEESHSLRLIFLLDRHQMRILEGENAWYFDFPKMQPQEDRGLTFALPPLPLGFHQLSVILITDPENTTKDQTARLIQQKTFSESTYDLWVGTQSLVQSTPRFASPEIGQAATRLLSADFVTSPVGEANKPLTDLTMTPGETRCLYLRLFYSKSELNKRYIEPVPLHIGVSWNDEQKQILEYQLSPNSPDILTLGLQVKAPEKPGAYQLAAAILEFPGYSQFDNAFKRTGFPASAFSRRILVEVVP